MEECKEELKSLLMKVKGESEKAGLKLIIQKTKIMASGPITSWEIERHYFVNKGPSSQSYGFSSGHAWMWELDYKDSWTLKNWWFWTVVLEKTLERPWTAGRSNQFILKISPESSLEGMMLKLKLQYFGHLMRRVDSLEKTLILGGTGGRRRRGRQRMRWLDGITDSMVNVRESGWTPGVGDGQGGLVCCNSWVAKSWTRLSN